MDISLAINRNWICASASFYWKATLPWNLIGTSSFTPQPAEARPPRLPTQKIGTMLGDKKYRAYEDPDEDYDEEDLDAIDRPKWSVNEVHVVQMPTTPFWFLARFVLLWFFLLRSIVLLLVHNVDLCRITALPYKRDGFWKGTVQRLYPQNKALELAWCMVTDGPAQEIFSTVHCARTLMER